MWVRPAFTTSANSSALRSNEPASRSRAGSSLPCASATAARCTAEGNTSLEDWPMFTWSLGWAPSPARLAITSLAFVFEEVPEPVWKTSMGNWSSCSPPATSSPAAAIRSAMSSSSSPSSPFTRAASALIRPSQRTTGTGTRSPETGKLSIALPVSGPHSSCLVAIPVLRLPKAATGALPPVERRRAALEGLGLLLEPAHHLAVDAGRARGAALGRTHQVAQAKGIRRFQVAGGPVRQHAGGLDPGGAQELHVVGGASVSQAVRQRLPAQRDPARRPLQSPDDGRGALRAGGGGPLLVVAAAPGGHRPGRQRGRERHPRPAHSPDPRAARRTGVPGFAWDPTAIPCITCAVQLRVR